MNPIGQMIVYDIKSGIVYYGGLNNVLGEYSDGTGVIRPVEETLSFLILAPGSTVLNEVGKFHIDITKDKSTTSPEELIIVDERLEHLPTQDELLQAYLAQEGVI